MQSHILNIMGTNQRLEQLFISYGSYHHNTINKWIHIICVPLILVSLLAMVHHITIFYISGNRVPLSVLLLVPIMLYYFYFSVSFGILCTIFYSSLWFAMNHLSQTHPKDFFRNALIIHVVCWILQFVGHGVFEKRKPALLDNITQVLSAPLFIVIEVVCMFGLKDFRDKVEPKILQNVQAFQQKAQQKSH